MKTDISNVKDNQEICFIWNKIGFENISAQWAILQNDWLSSKLDFIRCSTYFSIYRQFSCLVDFLTKIVWIVLCLVIVYSEMSIFLNQKTNYLQNWQKSVVNDERKAQSPSKSNQKEMTKKIVMTISSASIFSANTTC